MQRAHFNENERAQKIKAPNKASHRTSLNSVYNVKEEKKRKQTKNKCEETNYPLANSDAVSWQTDLRNTVFMKIEPSDNSNLGAHRPRIIAFANYR